MVMSLLISPWFRVCKFVASELTGLTHIHPLSPAIRDLPGVKFANPQMKSQYRLCSYANTVIFAFC